MAPNILFYIMLIMCRGTTNTLILQSNAPSHLCLSSLVACNTSKETKLMLNLKHQTYISTFLNHLQDAILLVGSHEFIDV